MNRHTWTDTLRLAGSRWATTPSYWVFALVALGLMSTVLVGTGRDDVTWWSALLANAVASVAALGCVVAIRGLAPIGFTAVLSIPLGAIVGLVRGVALFSVVGLLNGIALDWALIAQLATPSIVQCALLMPVFGLVGASIANWSERRDELVRLRTAQRVVRQRELGVAAPGQVTSFLNAAHASVRASTDDELAQQLRRLADVDVREFSRDLWKAGSADVPPFTLGELLKLAVIEHRFPALALGALGFVQMLFVQAYYVGFVDSLWRSALQGAAVVAVYAVGARIRTTTLIAGGMVFFGTILVMTASVFAMSYRWFPQISGFPPLLPTATSFLASAVLSALAACALVAGIQLARTIRTERMALADHAVTEVVSARVQRIHEHEAARLLHGEVQRSLRSLAHALAQSGDARAVRAEAERALAQAEQQLAFGLARPQSGGSLHEVLADCANRWAGLMLLEPQLSGPIGSLAADDVDTLAELLNEAVSNAHRHGGASEMRAEIVVNDHSITGRFADNGDRFVPSPAGLGSALCDAATGGDWQLVRGDAGCTLSFRIPRSVQG